MKDTLYCPICANKLSSKAVNHFSADFKRIDKFIMRFCRKGISHFLRWKTKPPCNKIITLSLNLDINKSIFIDFENNNSIITLYESHDFIQIKVPRVMELDFPSLKETRSKIKNYATFT